MTSQIEAVLFDMGGTLRRTIRGDDEGKRENVRRIMELIGANVPLDEFTRLLTTRADAYKRWAEETRRELNESDLWTRWMLPDWPSDLVSPIAIQLNQTWRDAFGTRVLFPETRDVAISLFRRGYRLALISNTTSSVEIPHALKDLGIAGCFEMVLLSCLTGTRKPDPSMLIEATRRMGIEPEKCVYIGDRPDRDVVAARSAGFAQVIILRDPSNPAYQPLDDPALTPDYDIDNLMDLLVLFPPRTTRDTHPLNASLSTMWAGKNFPTLEDFFAAAQRMGFAYIELNHHINSNMLDGIDLKAYSFSSVHEPCPADISTETLKSSDWLISSDDEENRLRGVLSIKRSIMFAAQIGAPVVVVHAGQVTGDLRLEKKLRALFEAGKTETDEYAALKAQMVRSREGLIVPRLKSVKKSLLELMDYADPFGICLGLENRYHYTDIPLPDEMESLLNIGDPTRLGMIFDVGHAQTLDRLGFFPLVEWLKRFSSRIIGVHLHDVEGVTDHVVPGKGQVDFALLASYLPEEAFRTFEIRGSHTYEEVKAGLQFMVDRGWVKAR